MHNFLETIPATCPLLEGGGAAWDADALRSRIACLRSALLARSAPMAPVAILADNSPEWLAIDLCTQALGITLIPLPLFFTPAQWLHAVARSGARALFCAQPAQAAALGFVKASDCGGPLMLCENLQAGATPDLHDVQKITFTSGTTASPKGVCLSTAQQWSVARALHAALGELALQRHLCLLPFAVLLENIAGPYTALLRQALTICPPLGETGLSGASGFDPQRCLAAIERYQPHSIILLPQMLQALVAAAAPHDRRIHSLRLVAVGGARTPVQLLAAAQAAGWPVLEGYGLSECSSVVALNLPGAQRAGSVGRPLPGRSVRIGADGEIEIAAVQARYLDMPQTRGDWFATGDLGHLDDDGFLYIDGRKKDVLITGYGRNVSPEWPESALLGSGKIAQALVVGEGQACLGALIVPLPGQEAGAQIQAAVDLANDALPDYARIGRWCLAAPFTVANGQLTANGRPRRAAIHAHYRQQIAALFDMKEYAV